MTVDKMHAQQEKPEILICKKLAKKLGKNIFLNVQIVTQIRMLSAKKNVVINVTFYIEMC